MAMKGCNADGVDDGGKNGFSIPRTPHRLERIAIVLFNDPPPTFRGQITEHNRARVHSRVHRRVKL